jgi:hypothetical protein
MGRYKDEYMSTTGKEREHVLRGHIILDIFNYWDTKGIILDEDQMEEKIKVREFTSFISDLKLMVSLGSQCVGAKQLEGKDLHKGRRQPTKAIQDRYCLAQSPRGRSQQDSCYAY